MISAFGVDHGISKAFNKVSDRMDRARFQDKKVKAHDTMRNKLLRHALDARRDAGYPGMMARRGGLEAFASYKNSSHLHAKSPREYKVASGKLYDTIGRLGRAQKVLP